jgi:hypothetical protein
MKSHSEDIEFFENLLSPQELLYLSDLMKIENPNFWIKFDEKIQYFDSIPVEIPKLQSFIDLVTENGKYVVQEIGLNLIQPNRQLEDSTHFDVCDFSYITYLNDDFEGGEFIYYVDDNEYRVKPYKGLSIKLKNKIYHKVDKVLDGKRFSLYVFVNYKFKNKKSIF